MVAWTVSVVVQKTFFYPMMDCLVNLTAHKECSCVATHTNVSLSGGSVMDKMTAVTSRMNHKLVPSLSALRANFNVGTVGTLAMRRIAMNRNVLKTNLNVQQMGPRMYFAFHLTENATKFINQQDNKS